MNKRGTGRGQGLLELAVILPVLLILLMGLVEIGYALRDYLIVVNASREGCRFAARGRFASDDVGQRVVIAGGIVRLGNPPADVPFLRTGGTLDPNTAIVVTIIPMDGAGDVDPMAVTTYYSGVVPSQAGGVRPILSADSGSWRTLLKAEERATGSPLGTKKPVPPSSTNSIFPPIAETTTGLLNV